MKLPSRGLDLRVSRQGLRVEVVGLGKGKGKGERERYALAELPAWCRPAYFYAARLVERVRAKTARVRHCGRVVAG